MSKEDSTDVKIGKGDPDLYTDTPVVNVTVTPDKDDFFRDNVINRLDQLIAVFAHIYEELPKIVRGLEKIADNVGKKPLR